MVIYMEQITIDSYLKKQEQKLTEANERETFRDRVNDTCSKALVILRDYDKKLKNVLYFNEDNLHKLSKCLSQDINPLVDEVIKELSYFNDIEMQGIISQYPLTIIKIYNFMNLYVKLCSIPENKQRLNFAKTILMLFPCTSQGEYETVTNKKPENIESVGNKIREQFELNNYKVSKEMIVPLSAYLFDVIYDHSLKEEVYTEAEEDVICYLAHIYLGAVVYSKSTERNPLVNPYIYKLEEMLVILFKNWKVTDDIDICWYHSIILRKYNQRMVKESAKIYTKNKEHKKICEPYGQISMF